MLTALVTGRSLATNHRHQTMATAKQCVSYLIYHRLNDIYMVVSPVAGLLGNDRANVN